MAKKTLEEILQKKLQGEMDKFKVKTYFSKTLDCDIEIHKIPLKRYMAICEIAENESESIDFMNTLLFETCPIFREDTKKAMEIYGVSEATELPSAILEDNLLEMKDICEIINTFYGFTNLEDEIKN